MGKRLDGSSLFSGINAGLANSFALLSSQYSDGLTLENLNKALTNTNVTNTAYGSTFASYLTTNFNSVDKNADGTISADEIQQLMNNMATQGLTREQIMSLGASYGMSTSLQETVLSHFDDIDTNKDGKVTNQEINAYGVNSEIEKQKIEIICRFIMVMILVNMKEVCWITGIWMTKIHSFLLNFILRKRFLLN